MVKLWYSQRMEYYLALNRNGLLSHKKTERAIKCLLLNERRQSKKAAYCMIPTI
jgi:hypothetical protein